MKYSQTSPFVIPADLPLVVDLQLILGANITKNKPVAVH